MGSVIHAYDSRVKPVTPFDIIVVRLLVYRVRSCHQLTNSATSPLDAPGIEPGSATFRFGLVPRRTIPRPYEILLNTLISNVQKKQYNDIVIQSPE